MSSPSGLRQDCLNVGTFSGGESSSGSSSSGGVGNSQEIRQQQAMASSPSTSIRRRRSPSSCTEPESSHTESGVDDETQGSQPPISSRRRAKRRRISSPHVILPAASTPPPRRPIPASTTPASTSAESHSESLPRNLVARSRNLRRPLPPPMQIQNAIVIDSGESDDDEDAVMASVTAPPAEIIGPVTDTTNIGRPLAAQSPPPQRRPRQDPPSAASTVISHLLSRVQPDPDSSTSDILFERIVRRASPIEVIDDSLTEAEGARARAVDCPSRSGAHRNLQASPPRSKPPPLANSLLSKHVCPICLSTPYPHVVATPCGHLYCSECLFVALHGPIRQRQDAIRDQMAAFSSLSTLNRAGLSGMAQAIMSGANGEVEGGAGDGDPAFQVGRGSSALRDGRGNVADGHQLPAAARSDSRNGRATDGSAASAAAGDPIQAPASLPAWAPPNKADPLVGVCPLCRAEIPGGFIAGHRPANKRPVFGLELKLGKPIDDPRRGTSVVGRAG